MKKAALFIFGIFLLACSTQQKELPYLGPHEISDTGDTVYHRIPDFSFVNQDGDTVTQEDVAGKIYVADFFFSTCPTICPIMKGQMLRIFEKYKDNDSLMILSHSINPRYDTPEVLKQYKEKLGVNSPRWQFLTGTQTDVYKLAQNSYLTSALEDSTAADEGGFVHSGAFVLIDKDRHIRAIYDGTKEKEVDKLMADIDRLLHTP
ncbi:SCO family protein [Leadbetterella sp. DM7]|uniref:SCO family protein n=1 Tax=Leadbetterella sp. DM7 TaxID=3235085 RepID=UPI00349E7AD3